MKINRWKSSFLLTLALGASVGLAAMTASADSTNLLARTTFDADAPATWGYGYYYGDGGLGVYEGPDRAYFEATDLEQINPVCRFFFDVSQLEGNTNYGTGFGAPQFQPDPNPALFASSNRADYVFSFDARAEGLSAGHATGNFEMQVQFMNSSMTPNNVLQVNLPFAASASWGHFSFHLDEAGFGADTSDKTFAEGYQGITGLQFNVNSHLPSDSFGFDDDNAILLDNLKLEVIVKPPSNNLPTPTFSTPVADWNFDDKPLAYSYKYAWTERGSQPAMSSTHDAGAAGVDGTKAWVLTMDNSALAADGPAWAGGGAGGEGLVDYSAFKSSELSAYRISFAARVEGLAPDSQTTTCALQLFLRAPDDVVLPADSDTDRDLVVQLNFPLSGLDTTWQTLAFTLDKGAVAAGSKASFAGYFNNIDQLQTQWQIENGAAEATWGFDADNALVIDNILIERIDPGCPPLSIIRENDELVANWTAPTTGSVKLQSSSTVNGQYTDVLNATSPYRVPISAGPKFFRTAWILPVQ